MLCVKCVGNTHVTCTAADNINVYRERVCTSCGHRFYTSENENAAAGYKLASIRYNKYGRRS